MVRERAKADSGDQVAETPQAEEALHQPTGTTARLPKKIGLLDHLGGGNLGDDATLDAVMQNIKRRWPDAEICGFSMNPSDTEMRHGIRSFPIRIETWYPATSVTASSALKSRLRAALRRHRYLTLILETFYIFTIRKPRAVLRELLFLAKSLRIIRSFDLLIISGGGQLLDSSGGAWKFPYTLFKWVLLAKLSRAKCYFVNVGAGPLNHPVSKWLIKRSLSLADYVSFRDNDSRRLIQHIGFTGISQVGVDNVYSLDIPHLHSGQRTRGEVPIVGFSPMAYCDPRVYWEKDQDVYNGFIRNLASFGRWLSQHHYRLALFSTDIWFDAGAIEDLKTALRDENIAPSQMTHEPVAAIDGLLSQMFSMSYIVTCRFHGVVFAHLLNKPVLALSHHPKVTTLMKDLGLADYCMDIRTCNPEKLGEVFTSLVRNSEGIKSRMADKLVVYQADLSMQFDHLFKQGAAR